MPRIDVTDDQADLLVVACKKMLEIARDAEQVADQFTLDQQAKVNGLVVRYSDLERTLHEQVG